MANKRKSPAKQRRNQPQNQPKPSMNKQPILPRRPIRQPGR